MTEPGMKDGEGLMSDAYSDLDLEELLRTEDAIPMEIPIASDMRDDEMMDIGESIANVEPVGLCHDTANGTWSINDSQMMPSNPPSGSNQFISAPKIDGTYETSVTDTVVASTSRSLHPTGTTQASPKGASEVSQYVDIQPRPSVVVDILPEVKKGGEGVTLIPVIPATAKQVPIQAAPTTPSMGSHIQIIRTPAINQIRPISCTPIRPGITPANLRPLGQGNLRMIHLGNQMMFGGKSITLAPGQRLTLPDGSQQVVMMSPSKSPVKPTVKPGITPRPINIAPAPPGTQTQNYKFVKVVNQLGGGKGTVMTSRFPSPQQKAMISTLMSGEKQGNKITVISKDSPSSSNQIFVLPPSSRQGITLPSGQRLIPIGPGPKKTNTSPFVPIAPNPKTQRAIAPRPKSPYIGNIAIEIKKELAASQKSKKPCNCTKSQCLKLYCDCFANGEFCSNCNCVNCHNNIDFEDKRKMAVNVILAKNPYAFHPKITKDKAAGPSNLRSHAKGCNCKRSGCLKNYCECYEAKIVCGELCKCSGCRNFEDSYELVNLQQNEEKHVEIMRTPLVPNKYVFGGDYVSELSGEQTRNPLTFLYSMQKHNFPIKPSPEDNLCNKMTPDVIDAVCMCMLASAEKSIKSGTDSLQMEKNIVEEFGLCLQTIIENTRQMEEELKTHHNTSNVSFQETSMDQDVTHDSQPQVIDLSPQPSPTPAAPALGLGIDQHVPIQVAATI